MKIIARDVYGWTLGEATDFTTATEETSAVYVGHVYNVGGFEERTSKAHAQGSVGCNTTNEFVTFHRRNEASPAPRQFCHLQLPMRHNDVFRGRNRIKQQLILSPSYRISLGHAAGERK